MHAAGCALLGLLLFLNAWSLISAATAGDEPPGARVRRPAVRPLQARLSALALGLLGLGGGYPVRLPA